MSTPKLPFTFFAAAVGFAMVLSTSAKAAMQDCTAAFTQYDAQMRILSDQIDRETNATIKGDRVRLKIGRAHV